MNSRVRATRSWLRRGMLPALAMLGIGSCGARPDRPAAEDVSPVYAAAPESSAARVMRFAVHPLHNPEKLGRSYQPLMDHLGRRFPGLHFELEASRDYANYEDKIRARDPEFLLANPWQALLAMECGYLVLASAGEGSDFKGIFLVRRDGPIRTLQDVRGRIVAYPAPTALAACIMPQWFLHRHGIDVNAEIENRYVGSQESAIQSVLLGQAAIGVTWPPPWRAFAKEHPAEAAQLRVAWETDTLVNNAVLARDDVPAAVRDSVRATLAGLQLTAEGRAVLAGMETARFVPADDADYDAVRTFVRRFEAEVRPVVPVRR